MSVLPALTSVTSMPSAKILRDLTLVAAKLDTQAMERLAQVKKKHDMFYHFVNYTLENKH